jgi:hypothetical protein
VRWNAAKIAVRADPSVKIIPVRAPRVDTRGAA